AGVLAHCLELAHRQRTGAADIHGPEQRDVTRHRYCGSSRSVPRNCSVERSNTRISVAPSRSRVTTMRPSLTAVETTREPLGSALVIAGIGAACGAATGFESR